MAHRSLIARFADVCLDASPSLHAWTDAVCKAAAPVFERGGGHGATLVYHDGTHEEARRAVGQLRQFHVAGDVFSTEMVRLGPTELRATFGDAAGQAFEPFRVSLASRLFGRRTMAGFEMWELGYRGQGYIDQLGIDFSSDRYAVLSTMIPKSGWSPDHTRDVRAMRRILMRTAHARLRADAGALADAVLAPDGRLLHAPDGLGSNVASMLSAAVRTLSRARMDGQLAEEGERIWDELVAGHWSATEQVDSDGKRLLLLSRSTPPSRPSPDHDLLHRIERGDRLKQIAIDLDLSLAAVSERTSLALAKRGFASRSDYLRFCGQRKR